MNFTDSATYANVFGFLGAPLTRDLSGDAGAAVLGIPYDLGTSARPGARFGPNAIRQASAQLRWEKQRWPWNFRLQDRLQVIDYGDISFQAGQHQAMADATTEAAAAISGAGHFLLGLGGDHFVSLPLLRGVARHTKPVALVHFDAHTDIEDSDLPFYHGNMFTRALEEGLIDPDHSIQVGIRTEYERQGHPLPVLDATWVNNHSAQEAANAILEAVANQPVYLSIDIDFLDPAFAPGTGTPVVGGPSTDKLLQILRALSGLQLVAADVMEVAPAYDPAGVTALAGATAALELLYLRAAG